MVGRTCLYATSEWNGKVLQVIITYGWRDLIVSTTLSLLNVYQHPCSELKVKPEIIHTAYSRWEIINKQMKQCRCKKLNAPVRL